MIRLLPHAMYPLPVSLSNLLKSIRDSHHRYTIGLCLLQATASQHCLSHCHIELLQKHDNLCSAALATTACLCSSLACIAHAHFQCYALPRLQARAHIVLNMVPHRVK